MPNISNANTAKAHCCSVGIGVGAPDATVSVNSTVAQFAGVFLSHNC